MRPLLLVSLMTLALPLPVAGQNAPPPPSISVHVEKIDPGNFPDVDVYFRVVDTVPSSAYRPLQAGMVKVAESPDGGGSFGNTTVTGDNFAKPDIRPLAITLAVDRSNSVRNILEKIQEATLRWLEGMSDNGPLPDDMTALNLFAGPVNMRGVLQHPLSADKNSVLGYARDNLTRTASGTPLHLAWNVSVHDEAASDYDVRAILTLTDGKNAPRQSGPSVDSIIQAARSNDIPMFNFAFVKFKGAGKVARNSVYRPDMIAMAKQTRGAYFEPIPPFPLLPDLPEQPPDPANPDSLLDAEAIEYLRKALGVVRNLLAEDPDAKFEDFGPLINRVVEPDVATQADFMNLDLENDATLQAGAAQVSWQDLAAADTMLEEKSKATVTEEDLRTFYVDQVENMFTKVRASLKTLYRVTYRSPNPQFSGKPRDIRLSVAYQTHVNALPLDLAGQGVGRYITPVVAEEDQPIELASSLDPASPVHDLLFGSAAAPRDGTWSGETQFTYQVELVGPDADGRPAVYATRTPEGQIAVSEAPNSPAASLDSADKEALTTYLSHLQFTAEPAGDALKIQLTARIPTCVRNAASPTDRPGENRSAKGFRKLLWYRIVPRAAREYDYTLIVPTAEGQPGEEKAARGTVKEDLPVLIVFIADTTPPTLALYLTPSRDAVVNRAAAVELPLDSATRPRPATALLTGKAWLPDLGSTFSDAPSEGTTAFPLTVEGQTVQGFFVNEDVRVDVKLLARDNYDRNEDASHVTPPGGKPASHNRYQEADPSSEPAMKGEPPYLPVLTQAEFGTKPGAILLLVENGSASPVLDSPIFRAPNVPTGDKIELEARAMDESRNVSVLRVPVYVMPVGFDVRSIQFESQRGK